MFFSISGPLLRVLQCCCFAIAFIGIQFAAAATQLQYKEANGKTYTILIGPDQVGSNDGFYSLKSDEFVIMDHQVKTYSKITRAELELTLGMTQKIAKQLEEMSAQMLAEEHPDTLDGESLGQKSIDELSAVGLKRLTSTKVAGYTCSRYEMLDADEPVAEVCLASTEQLSIPQQDIDGLSKAVEAAKKVLAKMPGMGAEQQRHISFLAEEGIPLALSVEGDKSWVLQSIKSSSASLSVPAGYSEVAIPMLEF